MGEFFLDKGGYFREIALEFIAVATVRVRRLGEVPVLDLDVPC
jgi:hypothetical protein